MTNAEPKGRGLKWKWLTKTEYGYKRRCGGKDGRGVQEKTAARSADTRDQWTRLDTRKANEKIEYGHKCGGTARRGAGPKRSDWQALAERAASEAKFVLIAERKTQEEA